MTMTYETYEAICEMIYAETDGEPTYTPDEIAEILNVSVEDVEYVITAEFDEV